MSQATALHVSGCGAGCLERFMHTLPGAVQRGASTSAGISGTGQKVKASSAKPGFSSTFVNT
jgi:hypothetical protein